MKQLIWMIAVICLLAGCNSQSHENIDMQQLQLLLVQAASLATMPDQQARAKAAAFARRAMSGPEMNAMHHGGGEMMPDMQLTHDFGDAVFSLLETRSEAGDDIWRSRLQLASQAAWMRLTGSMQGDSIGRFSYSEGRQLAALQWMPKTRAKPETPYAKAANRVVEYLNKLASGF